MAKLNRVCFTCGKQHSYCPTCYDDRHMETWHIMFDNENCKKVFEILNRHFYKHITDEEAIKELELCDLSEVNDDIKLQVDELFKTKVKENIKEENKTYDTPKKYKK